MLEPPGSSPYRPRISWSGWSIRVVVLLSKRTYRLGFVLALVPVALLVVLLRPANHTARTRGFGPLFVAGATASDPNASYLAVRLTVHAGDTLVGVFRTAGTRESVSDDRNGRWTRAATGADSRATQSLWYTTDAKDGSTTIALRASAGPMRMVVDEYSGLSSLHSASCRDGTGSSATTPTLAAASNGEFAYAGVTTDGHERLTALSPGKLRTASTNAAGEDVLSVSSAAVRLGFQLSAAPPGGWDACLALFRPTDGGWGSLSFARAFTSPAQSRERSSRNASVPAWNYGNGKCRRVLRGGLIEFRITASPVCDPGSDGHYRSDVNSPGGAGFRSGVYTAGRPLCTTVSVDFPHGSPPPIPAGSRNADWTWLTFAEMEDPYNTNQHDLAGWGMGIQSWWTKFTHNQWEISVVGPAVDGSRRSTWDGGVVAAGWHSLSICTNDASSHDAAKGADGKVYSIWFDGVRERFNHGPCAGSEQCNGFPLLQNDPTNEGPIANWPLIIDDYTGGRNAVPNTLVEGPPLVATIGSNGRPPEPPGGWNSP